MKFLKSFILAIVIVFSINSLTTANVNVIEGDFEPISDEVLGSKQMRALYSLPSKLWVESIGNFGRPASEIWSYLAFESAGTTAAIFTGQLGVKVTKDALIGVAKKYIISSPKVVCEELAASMMDVGLEAYRRNYKRYKSWKRSGYMSEDERVDFLRDNYTSNYLGYGKDLWADTKNYDRGDSESDLSGSTKSYLLKEVASLNESTSDVLSVYSKLKFFVDIARNKSLLSYQPYKDHLERISAFEKKSGVEFLLAKSERANSGRTQDLYEFGKAVFDMLKNGDESAIKPLVKTSDSDMDDLLFWKYVEKFTGRNNENYEFVRSIGHYSDDNKKKVLSRLSTEEKLRTSEAAKMKRIEARAEILSELGLNNSDRSLGDLISEVWYKSVLEDMHSFSAKANELNIDLKAANFSYCFSSRKSVTIVFNVGQKRHFFCIDAMWLPGGWLLTGDIDCYGLTYGGASYGEDYFKQWLSIALFIAKSPGKIESTAAKPLQYRQVENASREQMKSITATLDKLPQAQFDAFDKDFLLLLWMKVESCPVLTKVVKAGKLSRDELINTMEDAAFYDWNLRVLQDEGMLTWDQVRGIMDRNTRRGMKRP